MKKKRRKPKKSKPKVVEINVQEIEDIIDATATGPLSEEKREKLRSTLRLLIEQLGPESRNSEKLKELIDEVLDEEAPKSDEPQKPKKRKPGNGRNGAVKFKGAKKVPVPYEGLKPGDNCPLCPTGKVYPMNKPRVIIRLTGMAPVQATVYELERLRCNLCGEVFTAEAPEGVGSKKYDETVPSILAVLTYGSGFPRNRLAGLQGKLGIPLPPTTQWDLVKEAAEKVEPVFEELIRQAAQGDVLYSDDTSRKILKLERPPDDTRTGIFTSGIVSTSARGRDGPQIALFFTGRQHAGENLRDVLQHRAEELAQPITMNDALSRNTPKQDGVPMDVEAANCLAHGRRYFVDRFENFPEECGYVLEALGTVFYYDRQAEQQGLDPEERLKFHQVHSGPVMGDLHDWLCKQIDEKLVEPNSGLGKAINYLRNHWNRLTLFLRKAGAPLDNNTAERGLKKAVLHRKNALFYKTKRGAEVGDLFTSLIYTCELNGINPFEYLTLLQRQSDEVRKNPADWLPWNCPGLPAGE